MTDSSFLQPLSLPIPHSVIERAVQLAQVQPPETSVRVYRNAIAVLIASNYCTMMGFDIDWAASDALTPALGLTLDTAHLVVAGIGAIECRAVDVDATQCPIPPEACLDRVAYLIIRLDPNSRQADLLGFAATVQDSTIHLSKLQSIDDFGAYLLRLETLKLTQPITLYTGHQGLTDILQNGWYKLTDWLSQSTDDMNTIGLVSLRASPAEIVRSPTGRYQTSSDMQELSLVKSVTISNDLDHLSFLLNLQVIPCDHRMSEAVGDSENLKILHDIQASQPVKIQYLKVSVILQPDEPLQSVVLPQGLSLSIVDLHNHPIVFNSVSSLLEPNPDILSVQFIAKMGDIFEICLKFQEYSIHELIVV